MNKVTTIGSIVSLMTVLSSVSFADAPAVDATATPQTAVAQSSGRHHWYDGPLTQNAPQQPAVAQVPMATSADAQSELVLPSVSSVQSDSGVTPTLVATDAVDEVIETLVCEFFDAAHLGSVFDVAKTLRALDVGFVPDLHPRLLQGVKTQGLK